MNRFFNQHCISLVLGIAEGTYGADRTVNGLHDLMSLELRERGGNRERLGLIEHAVSPKAYPYLCLRTTSRQLEPG